MLTDHSTSAPSPRKTEPFAAIPHTACLSDLSDAAYRVLGAVLFFARRGTCDATDHQLAERCGKSVPAIQRSLRELETEGWIERRGGARRVIQLRSPGPRVTPDPEGDPPSEDDRPEDAPKEAGDRDWHERYEAYRRTAAWQRRRQCVFTRARGMCQVPPPLKWGGLPVVSDGFRVPPSTTPTIGRLTRHPCLFGPITGKVADVSHDRSTTLVVLRVPRIGDATRGQPRDVKEPEVSW